MKNTKLFSVLALLLLAIFSVSCSSDNNDREPDLTPSQTLSSTAWETTGAKNAAGQNVALTDASVAGFVGYSYFNANGTFKIYSLADALRSKGDWSISADGKTRTIIAKNDAGETLFTRVVDILVLTRSEFTYRIYPNANDKSVYYDIIHTPTTHKEPAK